MYCQTLAEYLWCQSISPDAHKHFRSTYSGQLCLSHLQSLIEALEMRVTVTDLFRRHTLRRLAENICHLSNNYITAVIPI